MQLLSLLIIAVGLSMDAFAVSICKGLSVCKVRPKNALSVALWFGGFQALMPVVGYFLGVSFADIVSSVDHWIAFILLGIIGGNMIKEALSKEEECADASMAFGKMLVLAIATSIDALALGVTFAFLQVDIWKAVAFIGVVTFSFSVAGIKIGNVFGAKYKSKAEFAGGLILILLGVKILLEHLGIL